MPQKNYDNLFCPVCASQSYWSVLKANKETLGAFEIIKCGLCGLSRTFPIPNEKSPTDYEYYQNLYYQNSRKYFEYMREILNIVQLYKTKGEVLDIGCGVGFLVELATKMGYNAQGIDPSMAARFAREERGLNIIQGNLFEAKFPDKRFDIIVMNHVLEHISEPVPLLREVNRILKNDGIFITCQPNIRSLMFFIQKANWYPLQPQEHLWQFTPKSVALLLEKGNFTVVKSIITSVDHRPYIGLKGIIKKIILGMAQAINLGDSCIIVARKVS